MHGGGVGGEEPGHRVQVPGMPGLRGVERLLGVARRAVGEDEAAQEVETLPVREGQRGPEVGAELGRHGEVAPAPGDDPVGEEAQYVLVRRRVRDAQQGLGDEPGGPPAVPVGIQRIGQLLQPED